MTVRLHCRKFVALSAQLRVTRRYAGLRTSPHRCRARAKISGNEVMRMEGADMTDLISINTFWTIWLFVHLILAVGLLGALTHQAMAVALPVRQPAGGIVTRFRAVPAAGYATAVCVLWVLTYIVGSYIYTKYRIAIRIPLEAGHYLQDRRLLRFQGACRDTRPRAAAGLLVFLEECAEPGIRQCAQGRDARSGRDVLVSLHRRPRPQQHPRVRIMSTTTGTASANVASGIVIGGVKQVQDIRHGVLHFRARRLLRDPVFQLSAVHVPPGDGSPRLGL